MPKNMNIHSADRQNNKANMNKIYVLIRDKFSIFIDLPVEFEGMIILVLEM